MPESGLVTDVDAALVARAARGDEEAVRALTERHNRRLYRIARGILRDDSEAEDVVQETYIRAFTRLDSFRGASAFGTWLTRIAMNEALGRVRKRRPTVVWEPEREEVLFADLRTRPHASSGSDPERAIAEQEIRELLEQSIDRLPDVFRPVFIARMVEGMSVEETAELFGIPPETVKTRVHRARQRLRRDLERELGPALTGTFPFDGERCGRITDAVVKALSQTS